MVRILLTMRDLTPDEVFNLANDLSLYIALEDAIRVNQENNPLSRMPFHTIGQRKVLIEQLEKQGLRIIIKE